ncbi:MAG TPA: hypothetical protein VG963_09535 [Polyangiaceae bacterium]|nr:hypothetical protein [Polyangiaceae bacterium]
MRSWGIALAALLGTAAALHASGAAADASSCTAAHTAGQREMKAGHLKVALERFNTCGADRSCPSPVRRECVELFGSVQSIVPTLVFAVSAADGRDLTDVKVFSSGELLMERLDGRPVPVDPGEQGFLFELPSGGFVTADVLVRQGEKNRIVAVQTAPAQLAPRPVAHASPAVAVEPEPSPFASTLPPSFWAASSVGVAALGVWGTLALIGRTKQVDLGHCSPRCDPGLHGEYHAMKREYLAADISLGVAATSFAVATAIWIVAQKRARSERSRADTPHPSLAFAPVLLGRAGGALALASSY